MTLILGIAGMVGSGKTTVAGNFIQGHGFRKLSFADPIRAMMVALGVPMDVLTDTVRKEQPHPALCGKTPRHAMETLGTSWGRERIDPQIWLNLFKLRAAQCDLVICDDVRFQNEADAIKEAGGVVFRLVVPGREPRVNTDLMVRELTGVEDITNDIGVTKINDIYLYIYGRLFQTIDSSVSFEAWKNG